jgi:serine/threonine-protein kinase
LDFVVGERYSVGAFLGRGGIGEVYRGRDLRLGREIAVKLLRSDLHDGQFFTLFLHEALSATSLNHPTIVAIYDTGQHASAIGPRPYLIMELIEGETLRQVLQREGRLSVDRALTIAMDMCIALDFAHKWGEEHGDLKPSNVMLTRSETVKVLDFGVARAMRTVLPERLRPGLFLGTLEYLAPEQLLGGRGDGRSDLYSLACVLYEMVTGFPPVRGDSFVSMVYQHRRGVIRTPSSAADGVPFELDRLLLQTLAKDPDDRYQSAETLLDAFRSVEDMVTSQGEQAHPLRSRK